MLRTVGQGLCLLGKSTIRPAQAQWPLVYLEPKWLRSSRIDRLSAVFSSRRSFAGIMTDSGHHLARRPNLETRTVSQEPLPFPLLRNWGVQMVRSITHIKTNLCRCRCLHRFPYFSGRIIAQQICEIYVDACGCKQPQTLASISLLFWATHCPEK